MSAHESSQDLEGTALKAYVFLLRKGPAGPREMTKALGLSSPSLAYYHLNRLEELGLVRKLSDGRYEVSKLISVKGHFFLGKWLVPRFLAYSAFFIGVLAVELLTAIMRLWVKEDINSDLIALIIITATAAILFLIEGIKALKTLKIVAY